MTDTLAAALTCPRCGATGPFAMFGPCEPCRLELRRIYDDRNRVRIASLAHLLPEQFNEWLRTPSESLGGDTPWQWIDAGFTDRVIEYVKTLRRLKPVDVD